MTNFDNPPSYFDSAWKDALDGYFTDFMQFFYNDIAEKIDWQAGYEMLDKEFQSFMPDSEVGKRLVDKLIRVHFKGGQQYIVLLHVELQTDCETHFPERLFQYFYRLYDRYQSPILTLVVLADDRRGWRPEQYQIEVSGYHILTFQFLTKI